MCLLYVQGVGVTDPRVQTLNLCQAGNLQIKHSNIKL